MWDALTFIFNAVADVFAPLYAADRRRDARRSALSCLAVFVFVVVSVGLGVVLWQRVMR